jgi:hypothetical protein
LLADGAGAETEGPDADGVESEVGSASSNCRTGRATATARNKAIRRKMLSALPAILLDVMARMLNELALFAQHQHDRRYLICADQCWR